VRHSGEMKLRGGIDTLTKKTIKNGRRCRAIEASVMKAQANFCTFRHYLEYTRFQKHLAKP
jgi:hypothetical protein